MPIKNISAEEMRELIKNNSDNLEIIDVREPEEYASLRIKDSKLIPSGELSSRVNEIDWNKKVVFHCKSGIRSRAAAEAMSAIGKNVNNLESGIFGFYGVGAEFLEGEE